MYNLKGKIQIPVTVGNMETVLAKVDPDLLAQLNGDIQPDLPHVANSSGARGLEEDTGTQASDQVKSLYENSPAPSRPVTYSCPLKIVPITTTKR
ncbi:MAG: hypothetical protein IPJ40_03010 [Saprospirales bacterium]|nr:hypothetical protein [Saprospirales bacterium]